MKKIITILFIWSSIVLSGCDTEIKNSEKYIIAVVDVDRVLHESRLNKLAKTHLAKVRENLNMTYIEVEVLYGPQSKQPDPQAVSDSLVQLERQYQSEVQNVNNVIKRLLQNKAMNWQVYNPNSVVITREQLLAAGESTDITNIILSELEFTNPIFENVSSKQTESIYSNEISAPD